MQDIRNWSDFFKNIKESKYGEKLFSFIDEEYSNFTCYPPKHLLFNAFDLTPIDKIKVVLIGQDPYHEPFQAMGLAFSVPDGVKLPPSLVNIFKEIQNELSIDMDFYNGDLTYLAKQGILMLNSYLSVRAHTPLSHNIKEYSLFFEDVLTFIDTLEQPIVFLLWGGQARKLKKHIKNPNRLILEANHPSPLSANRGGWFGCGHFKRTNEFLKSKGLPEINWDNKKY